MKTLIAVGLLLALTTPAFAVRNYTDWECDNEVGITGESPTKEKK